MFLWLASTGIIPREPLAIIRAPKTRVTKPLNRVFLNVKKKKVFKAEVIKLAISLNHSLANQEANY